MFEDHNEFLHGSRNKKDRIISAKFIRKYLYVAKMQNPILTKVHTTKRARIFSDTFL